VPVSNAPASVSSSPKTTSPAVAASTAAAPVGSIYFDFDSTVIKDQYSNSIRAEAALLGSATKGAQLEGNADERGSREYNMALGQKRADAVKRALTALGAKPDRIETVSYGEDKPRAKGHDEAAWAENRRVDFTNK
jgi:peptidoglycan-associated lipoprotein